MRRIYVVLFFCVPFLLPSQNYQNICTQGTTFYKDTTGSLKAFRLDSVYPLGNNDTIFISYRTIREQSMIQNCRDTTNGSVLGRKIYKRHDGWFFFFNWNGDTVSINSQAVLNENWHFCKLSNGGYLQAEVKSLIEDSVLGVTDMVKVISFQAKNSSGQNIGHILNQQTIKLSQHYGLTKMFDIYEIPDFSLFEYLRSYTIAGKTDPLMGAKGFTWKDAFDVDTGDIFHYAGFSGTGAYLNWTSIKRILDKTVYGNYDSIRYMVEFCKLSIAPQPPPNTFTMFDTIYETFNLVQFNNDPSLQRLPEEFTRIDMPYQDIAPNYTRSIGFYNGRPAQQFCNEYSVYWPADQCWRSQFEGIYNTVEFAPGLGQTMSDHIEYDINVYRTHEAMVYYKKGNESWGTPVSNDCHTLVSTEKLNPGKSQKIIIVPNPVVSDAEIFIESSKAKTENGIQIFDPLGRIVYTGIMTKNPYEFDRQGLQGGLYILKVVDRSGKLIGMTKMLIE